MDRILAFIDKVVMVAELVAPHIADEMRGDAEAVKHVIKNNPTIVEWIKHHGNLPGTPESRAAAEHVTE